MIKLDIEDYSSVGSTYSIANYIEYKDGNKNIFEEVIDSLILEKYSNDNDLKEYIKALPLEDKRMAILSLLDTDNKLWTNLKTLIKGNKVSKVDHLREVIEMFRTYVKVADVEKKKHGEVMSPIDELVKPMIKLVPEEFWTNPDHKILDSSAGIGTFPIMCLYKLMNGLKDWEPDVDKRFKHIVENMLYYGELQARNVFLYLCALDPNDEYNLNIYWGSFLENSFDKHMKEVWNVESFDLIIQNPPYQLQREGFKKTQPLWHLFVQKSISILSKDKYMVMVHPSGWRNIDGIFKETQVILKYKEIIYLEIHDSSDGNKIFGASTRYDFYCLKNKESNNFITEVRCQDGSVEFVDLTKLEFIPNGMFNEINELFSNNNEPVNLLYSRSLYGSDKKHMNKVKNDINSYPCVQNVNIKNEISCFHYSNTNKNGHFNVPKVIFGRKSSGVYIDFSGEYGLSQDCCGIVDDLVNLKYISIALKSKKFLKISSFCDVGGVNDRYSRKIISYFRKDFWRKFI